ncbi:hypothetical protein V5P93_003819 [Actinokineospora auranticolor]|uniref:Uncharacterized protein n=1 Tax=Actinokineospora auranticolor TaxID=155976 RepID=A0A2S6GLR5_9PSEU|nr:hypothetical protein [Actinokineospora auranticolor]PPK66106.1 hypothetical protein CLV40_11170 [Actinokineospora auranticolor]
MINGCNRAVDPFGWLPAGPVFGRTDLLVADVDPDLLAGAYLDLDVSGHYSRSDLSRLDHSPRPARMAAPPVAR